VDATYELALDAKARVNLMRPRPAQLEIDGLVATLAKVTLDGDGRTAPRGVVAVLAGPYATIHRGIYAHRELYPFDAATDECLWPTRALVDDARLVPDRTWSRAELDPAWEALVTAIRNASEAALRELVRPPPRALASEVIGASSHAELPALRGDSATQIRGALWLDGPPNDLGRLDIVHPAGPVAYLPPGGVPLRGTLHLSVSFHDLRIQDAIGELCEAVYKRLLRKLAERPSPSDLALAQLAYGIARGHIGPSDARGLKLGCFRPRPLDAREWETLCWSMQRVQIIAPGAAADDPPDLSIVDDDSATARVVLAALGPRAHRDLPTPLPSGRPERAAAPLRDAPPVRPAHPLDPLLAAVSVRLQALGLALPRFRILDGATAPLAAYADGVVEFAGEHPQLIAITASLLARTPWSEAAVDALTAHVVTVLNVALTSVTDATEGHALAELLRRA
jgi:hypothetical protein